jgi:hypothetical protein
MSSITPRGGWDDPQRQLQAPTGQKATQAVQYAYLVQPQSSGTYFQCKICDRGALIAKRMFRMSGPAVAIGFILLIPSIVGILFSGFLLLGSASATHGASLQTKRQAIRDMREAGIPGQIINAVVYGRNREVDEWLNADISEHGRVTYVQEQAIKDAQSAIRTGYAGAGLGVLIGGGLAITIGITSFVGGLLGWLLVMRKRVLQCCLCGAVVNAS